MASLSQWAWVSVNSRIWWWTGRPGVLQSMGSQRLGHNWRTQLNYSSLKTLNLFWRYCWTIIKCWAPKNWSFQIVVLEKPGTVQWNQPSAYIGRGLQRWLSCEESVAQCRRCRRPVGVPSLSGGGNSTHSSILACRIPWTEGPLGLQSIGS